MSPRTRRRKNPRPRAPIIQLIATTIAAVRTLEKLEPFTTHSTRAELERTRRALDAALDAAGYPVTIPDECPGHGRGGQHAPCCDRAGEYNGFGSNGPLSFICPNHCPCHD
jgi:hypothetical protein